MSKDIGNEIYRFITDTTYNPIWHLSSDELERILDEHLWDIMVYEAGDFIKDISIKLSKERFN